MIVKTVAMGYIRLFPELLDRYYRHNDMTIVELIAEKVITKSENKFINVGNLKKDIVDLLKKGL